MIYPTMKDLKNIIMSSIINKKIFSSCKDVYIVGGYLRDILRGKKSSDIDYITRRDLKQFTDYISKIIRLSPETGTLVELKKERMIRIALKNRTTLDFTRLTGRLEDNLKERDFTMNALSWSPETGIIDLFSSEKDIKKNIIRAISIENLRADPVRLLRAYRFAAELGWDIDAKTRKMVRELNSLIKKSAYERITLEFFKLLNSKNYQRALRMAFDDGLIENIISINNKTLKNNINSLSMLESRIKKLPSKYKHFLKSTFSQELTLAGMLRLEQILSGSVLSKNRLRLSRLILERLENVHKMLDEFKRTSLSDKGMLFDALVRTKDSAFDLLILSGNLNLLPETERFKKIWGKSLLSSEKIMSITGLKESVGFGRLIYRLKKLQFEGKLKTKKEVIKWLRHNAI